MSFNDMVKKQRTKTCKSNDMSSAYSELSDARTQILEFARILADKGEWDDNLELIGIYNMLTEFAYKMSDKYGIDHY